MMTYAKLLSALLIVQLLSTNHVLAMTPGAQRSHWRPEVISKLTLREIHLLKTQKCQILSYRDQELPINASGKPDEQDELMLVRGEFATSGQQDLLVLCQHTDTGEEFFAVVWGGTTQCESILIMKNVSRYWKERGQLDYYGSNLDTLSSAHANKFLNDEAARPSSGNSDMGSEKRWIMQKQQRPELKHDSFALFGNYGVMFYCNGNNWIKLYDYYSTMID